MIFNFNTFDNDVVYSDFNTNTRTYFNLYKFVDLLVYDNIYININFSKVNITIKYFN